MSDDFDSQAVWAYVYKVQRDERTGEPEPAVSVPGLRLGYFALTSVSYEDMDCIITHIPTGCRMGGYAFIPHAKTALVRLLNLGGAMNTRDPETIRTLAGPILETLDIISPDWRDIPFTESVPPIPDTSPQEPTP